MTSRNRFTLFGIIAILTVIAVAIAAWASFQTASLRGLQPQQVMMQATAGMYVEEADVMAYAVPLGQVAAPAQAVSVPPTPADMFFEDYGVNLFVDTGEDSLSTFAMDVDTASYTLTRSYLTGQDQLPPPEAIRPEEFVNYFDAGYESPDDSAFDIHLDAAPSPFGEDLTLLRVGVQGRYIDPADRDPALLIFVIDVSGSMATENRLGLVKEALELLVGELREDDRVGIVVYSDNSRIVLEPTPASDADTILNAINRLQTEGSTNAEAGLVLGYEMAERHMREGETTRIILSSDGVANVGATGPDAILATIREHVAQNITLSAVGFGMGNFNDVLMEQLANDGDGNYYYVDNLREARRVFVHNLTGTLQVIGYDARIQVEFNPEIVDRYRLIGYENRAIADEDFRDDTVDAGEVGAGHSVTALYELALSDDASAASELATVHVRYEDGDTRETQEVSESMAADAILESLDTAAPQFRLQAAAGEFSELLRASQYAEGGSFGEVRALLEPLQDELPGDAQVAELIDLVRMASRFTDR